MIISHPCNIVGANKSKITDLRSVIPRLVEPFQRPSNSATFKQYALGVLGSQEGIKSLNEHWKSPETRSIFEHTKKSLAANGDLSASQSIPPYGWIEREKKERDSKKSSRSESTDESSTSLTEEEISRIVVDFQKAYPNIKLETQDDNCKISVGQLTCHYFHSLTQYRLSSYQEVSCYAFVS
jgi:hypothetical protein